MAVAAAAVAAASGSMVAAPRPCGTAALRQHGRGGMCVVVAAHRGGGGGYSTSTIVELQYEYAVARLPSRDFLALSRTLFFAFPERIKGLRADPSRLEVTRIFS